MRHSCQVTAEELVSGLHDVLKRNQEEIDKLDLEMVEHEALLEENRREVVKDYIRSLRTEAQPYIDAANEIESTFSEYTITKREHPPKWMENEKTAKVFKETKFREFMQYIKSTDTLELTRSLQKHVKVFTRITITGKKKKVTREIRLYAINYPHAMKRLDLTKEAIQRYLAEAVRIEMFNIVCKGCGGSSHRPTIYDLGDWNLETGSGNIQLWHYKETKAWIDKIASFSPFKRCYKGT